MSDIKSDIRYMEHNNKSYKVTEFPDKTGTFIVENIKTGEVMTVGSQFYQTNLYPKKGYSPRPLPYHLKKSFLLMIRENYCMNAASKIIDHSMCKGNVQAYCAHTPKEVYDENADNNPMRLPW